MSTDATAQQCCLMHFRVQLCSAHTEKESLKNDHATRPQGLICPVLSVTFTYSSGSQSDASDELVAVAPLS